jgi:SNF2 family DNA or RNA helicase
MTVRPHQAKAIQRGMRQNFLAAHGCGTGKSLTAIHLIAFYAKPCLIIAPASVVEGVWSHEIAKWMPSLNPCFLVGTPKKRAKLLAESRKVFVVSYGNACSMFKELVNKGFNTVVLDESSQIRNPKSRRTAMALALAGQHTRGGAFPPLKVPIPHRFALSGTPAPNERYEYWGQVKFVAGLGRGLDDNFYRFREQFYTEFMPAQNVRLFRFKSHLEEDFNRLIAPWVDAVRTADVLPDLQSFEQIRQVELSQKERQVYDSMLYDKVIQTESLKMLTKNCLTLVGHLRQLTSGFIYRPAVQGQAHGEVEEFGHSKLDELEDLLAEIGDRAIIWYNYDHEKDSILKRIKGSVWAGDLKNRNRILTDFEIGRKKYLVANPASLGMGVNLQYVHHAVFFSLSPSYDGYEQARRRILRSGQNDVCGFYFLTANKTYDQALWKIIQRKESVEDATLNYLKECYHG